MKSKENEKSKELLEIKILLCYEIAAKNKRNKRYADFGVLIGGIILQLFNTLIINHLEYDLYSRLKSQSLMLGMASSLALSTIVVFGFNLGKSVQQFWKEKNRKHGLDEKEGLMMSGMQINYWQLGLVILLYVCIAIDWCTLFYILLAYDVLCYALLILKLWLIENIGEQYLSYSLHNQKDMEGTLIGILEKCIDDNSCINIGIVRTYIEGLSIYLNLKEDGRGINGFYAESLYESSKSIFNNTMEKLVLDRDTQSLLLLSIIRNFCKEIEKFDDFKAQIVLGVMITYALDWRKNINIEILYKEITNWNDKTLGLRYCIAVARMEYLHAVHKESNRILLSENVFLLYRPVLVELSYRDIICVLWYLWCCDDEKKFVLYTENMWHIIRVCGEDVSLYHVSEAGESLYMLMKGLKN